jgi:NAD(P)H-hydrate epimerase
MNNLELPIALYLTEQIKVMEQAVIQQGIISGFELMERAGAAVFTCLKERYPVSKIAVFCGSGNNAGDGYVVATLALKAGMEVCVHAITATTGLQGDALTSCQGYIDAGGVVTPFRADVLIDAELVVDALFGTGLNRCVSDVYAQVIMCIDESQLPVISIDIPSGLNADTGDVMGCAIEADVTATFIGLKQGLFTGFAAQHVGDIVYASLDLPGETWKCVEATVYRVLPKSLPPRHRYAHKGNYGHVLVIGGDIGYSGAARLAGMAALRVGAGLVSIATHPENAAVMNIAYPELMCRGIDTVSKLEPLLAKASIIVVGTGLGQRDWAKALFDAALATNKPLVIDADALNLLAQSPCKKDNWVLTPHARLSHKKLA